ncbi:MAG: RimK family alpha-L-glutamate ligase [Chloroflexota bacterium]
MRQDVRIGVVTSDPNGLHSSQLLAAANRVARGEAVDPVDLSLRIEEHSGAEVWFGRERADAYDALVLRGLNNKGLTDLQLEGYRLVEEQVPVVVNRIGPILTALDKARSSFMLRQAGLPTPATVVTQHQAEAEAAVKRFGEAVLKPLYGSLGEDLVRVEAGIVASAQIERMLSQFGAVYVQRFVAPGGRDIRAFVIGGEVVAAIYRTAADGEWITNVFRGATTKPVTLSPRLRALCTRAAEVIGLDYTGVDVIEAPDGPTILEVNGTPSWTGIDEACHRSMAREIVEMVVQRAWAEKRVGKRDGSRTKVA